jgi:DNA polymerase III epsilon subunit-like protein
MFTKDLLVIDTETTGLDIAKHSLIQVAALRLDRSTLAEIDRYASYVQLSPEAWQSQDPKALEVHKIPFDTLKDAPTLQDVIKELESRFNPEDVLLSAYNLPFDSGFLYEAYRRLGRRMPYDFHGVDIWAFAYQYWCNVEHTLNPQKRLGFGLSDVAALLGVTTTGAYHDALTDCEVEAEVLRKLLARIS